MASEQGMVDVTTLILQGLHPVLELGADDRAILPYSIGTSAATHANGAPLAHDAVIQGIRSTVGLDESGSITHWSIKHSLQEEDRKFMLSTGPKEVNLWEVTAFGFMTFLEAHNLRSTREIWSNDVCIVTVTLSGVSLSFDLAPSIAHGPALIQKAATPLTLVGDVHTSTAPPSPEQSGE